MWTSLAKGVPKRNRNRTTEPDPCARGLTRLQVRATLCSRRGKHPFQHRSQQQLPLGQPTTMAISWTDHWWKRRRRRRRWHWNWKCLRWWGQPRVSLGTWAWDILSIISYIFEFTIIMLTISQKKSSGWNLGWFYPAMLLYRCHVHDFMCWWGLFVLFLWPKNATFVRPKKTKSFGRCP